MLRCVVDPGVLIAARLSGKGAPADLIRRWMDGQLDLVASPMLLDEVARVLARDKFRRWLSIDEVTAYLLFLRSHATIVPDPPAEHGHCRDPGDDYLVSLARGARAHALISGNPDLVTIRDAVPRVLTPRELVTALDLISS